MELRDRTLTHVHEFYKQIKDDEIQRMFPFGSMDLGEHIAMYKNALKPDASSFGKVIYSNGSYIGDIWCYNIDEDNEQMALLSIVIFNKSCWSKGIGPWAITEFTDLLFQRYAIEEIGAFTYANNQRSRQALINSGFCEVESFVENGETSYYYSLMKTK